MIGNALLALGVVLTTASQLRIPGMPLGPGELCLVLWLALASLRIIIHPHIANATAFFRIGAFWLCFTFVLSVGTCLALLRDQIDLDTMSHDAFAYVLMAAMTCLIIATLDAKTDTRRTAWFVIVFWNIAAVLQIAIGWQLVSLGSVDPWYWDRFRGWSENPNQLALYCAVLTPLAVHLAMSSRGAARIAALLSAALSVVVGRLTKSDTFLVAMSIVTLLFCGLRLRTWLMAPEHKSSLRFAFAALFIVAAVPLSVSLGPYAIAAVDEAESLAISLSKDRGGDATKETAALRIQLWGEALQIGLEAGSIGLGPGPHLARPNIARSQLLPTPFEAHSTVLDVFTQAGLIGVIAVCGLIASAFILLVRARLDALAALIGALSIFSISHFILRHPIFWFALAVSLILGSAHVAPSRARMRT